MRRFLAWFRWEWRDHYKLVIGCALGTVFLSWVALLLGRPSIDRGQLEGVFVGEIALVALVLAAGLFGSERRHGADALLLRTPRARVPLFLARLAFLATAVGSTTVVAAFGAARVAHLQAEGHGTLQPPQLEWFLWPRFIVADALLLAVAMACVGLLASAWTRRVTVAFVLGLLLPAAVLFPWIYLGASRADFLPFYRLGAIPLVAWPLLLLALVTLGVSWFVGRRYLNRPWRAVTYGALVLALGVGIAGAWTAQAFATFDDVRADASGFRMESYPIGFSSSSSVRYMPSGLPLDSVALSPDGRVLWVQGFRRDAGTWPNPLDGSDGSYGPNARDFRENRGTWSRQWRIDLDTGEAEAIGAVRERISWYDLGSGRLHGLLRGVDMRARLAPRTAALLGRPGDADKARIVDLTTGSLLAGPQGSLSYEDLRAKARAVAAGGTSVRDAEGRPVWLEMERPQTRDSRTLGGMPHVFIASPAGRTPVEHERVRAMSNVYANTWIPVPGGWARQYGTPRYMTLDVEGRVRTSTKEQVRKARDTRYGHVYFLDTRFVLVLTDRAAVSGSDWGYVLLDLETGAVSEVMTGPPAGYIIPTPTPDGRLVCLERVEGGRRLVYWAPRTNERTVIPVDGEARTLPDAQFFRLHGADVRGNLVARLYGPPKVGGGPFQWVRTFYVHAASATAHGLDAEHPESEGPGLHAIGIDAQDRVVGLAGHDGNGYRTIERFDPADGSRTVLFPKGK